MKVTSCVAALGSFALSACANIANPTPESLGNDFAGVLGVRPGEVQVTNIQSQDNKTYFTATTAKGTYECSMDSGVLVAAVSPTINRRCTPKQ